MVQGAVFHDLTGPLNDITLAVKGADALSIAGRDIIPTDYDESGGCVYIAVVPQAGKGMTMTYHTAWITGASDGMGRELALLMARRGIKTYITARRADKLEALAQQSENLVPLPGDVSDADSMRRALETVQAQSGLPDLVVLNAAIYDRGPTHRVDLEMTHRHFAINVMGVLNISTPLLPGLLEAGHGHLVIVGSVAGYRGLPISGIYGATKSALISYAESLRAELQDTPVTVQVANPGFMRTAMTAKNDSPMPFIISPEEAANRLWRGICSGKFEITFPKRAAYGLKFLRLLPYGLYFRIARRMMRKKT